MKKSHKVSFIVFLIWLLFQVSSYFYGYYLHRELWQCEFRVYIKLVEELRNSGLSNPREEISRNPETFLSEREKECGIAKDGYVKVALFGKIHSKDFGYHLIKYPLVLLIFAFIIFCVEIILKRFRPQKY